MIEAHVDVKASVGYLLHLFCAGFTKNLNNQSQKTSYTKHSRKTYWKNLQLFKTLLNFSFVIKNATQQL